MCDFNCCPSSETRVTSDNALSALKEAKEKLVLPFYTDEQKQSVVTAAGEVKIQGEVPGKIYYEPDSGDDWDDDDPDDDLDF